jgi:hypothetical protein
MKINAFTPVVLACRKILMHVAVEKGAKKGGSCSRGLELA